MLSTREKNRILVILALTQIISWGSIYYAFSILAPEIVRESGWRSEVVFGAFSWCLLVAGLASPPAGILLDRYGGRHVMGMGSLVSGAGLILLAHAHSMAVYFAAWTILGVAMAMVLYEAAFATINREFVVNSRKAVSILTLFGGFASTVFWPLTLYLNTQLGWRDTYLIYGVAQLVLCLPAHLLLTTRQPGSAQPDHAQAVVADSYSLKQALAHPAFWKLAFAFAFNAFVFSALSVHLIPLMHQIGHPMATIVFFAAMIGPMQVAGRIGEMAVAHRSRPQTVGKLTFALLPMALLVLLLLGNRQWALALFCSLYGLSNGILTIVRATIPRELFGQKNYGAISGALAGPSLLAKAAGPVVIAALIEAEMPIHVVLGALLVVALLSLASYHAALRVQHKAM